MWFSDVFRLVFAWKASILTPTWQFWHWHHPLFHAASGTVTLRTFCLHHGVAIFVNLQVLYDNSDELHVSYCFLLPYTSFSNMWLHYGAYWIVICCNKVENHTIHDSVNCAGALHKNLISLSKNTISGTCVGFMSRGIRSPCNLPPHSWDSIAHVVSYALPVACESFSSRNTVKQRQISWV